MTKLIIAGGRNLHPNLNEIAQRVKGHLGSVPSVIVSGGALGMDKRGEEYAELWGIDIVRFLPEYNRYPGREAPKYRNIKMAEYADALLAFWDGISGGTAHMIAYMTYLDKPCYVVKAGL